MAPLPSSAYRPPVPARLFDQKFGADFLATVPHAPGVYRYCDDGGEVLYVGKAKDLRRRLAQYRNASRKKAHRKMVRLVKAASSLSFEQVASEEAALTLENRLIIELRPKYNVDGAFSFLYPAIGVGQGDRHTTLCFTTQPELYAEHELQWAGTFRSRMRAKLAFNALVDLLSLLGHREKSSSLPAHPRIVGSRFVAFRQLPLDISAGLPWFFMGEEPGLLGQLATLLLLKPRARRDAPEVQEKLAALKHFWDADVAPLRTALRKLGRPGSFVSGRERDQLFIRSRFQRSELLDEHAP